MRQGIASWENVLDALVHVGNGVVVDLPLQYLTDDEYGELQTVLIEQPEAGAVIPGAHVLRQIRKEVEND